MLNCIIVSKNKFNNIFRLKMRRILRLSFCIILCTCTISGNNDTNAETAEPKLIDNPEFNSRSDMNLGPAYIWSNSSEANSSPAAASNSSDIANAPAAINSSNDTLNKSDTNTSDTTDDLPPNRRSYISENQPDPSANYTSENGKDEAANIVPEIKPNQTANINSSNPYANQHSESDTTVENVGTNVIDKNSTDVNSDDDDIDKNDDDVVDSSEMNTDTVVTPEQMPKPVLAKTRYRVSHET